MTQGVLLVALLLVLSAAVFVVYRYVQGLLHMSDAEIKSDLNKDAPIDMIDRQNELKRRRMRRR